MIVNFPTTAFSLMFSAFPANCRKRFLPLFFVLLSIFSVCSQGFAQDDDDKQVEAIKIFNQAQDAHEKGDFETAVKLYNEALKLAPEFPEVEYQRGNALLSINNSSEAEKAFRRAIALREDWTLPMASLGSLLISKGEYAEAETVLTKAVGLDAQNFPAYVALAELRLKTKAAPDSLKELLAKLQSLTSKANPTASLWAARGAIEFALNNKVAAQKSLDAAISIEPKNTFALTVRTEIFLSENDFTRALSEAKLLNQFAPNSIGAKILLARVYAESGNRAEASKILDALDSSNAEVSALRNSIKASDSVSVSDLEKQLETDAKNGTILGRLCNLLRTENPLKALDYCRRASEAEPENINHAVGYGAALVQAKQYDSAIIIFRKIIQIAPDNFTAHANLATALFQLKRFAEAKPEYQWLAEKQPNLPVTYYFLAIAHDSLGEYVDAMANYQQFLKLADSEANKLEIEKVNLRLPAVQKFIKEKKGRNK